ncbi:restriction endonuclease subunit S [Sulfuricystis multivorans]|uniref:restriction endonuclease subunit S n=1 Tax=Sulfuricystis multivorans TaxID=2211108 RepID=UPI0024DFCD71|nr:hypothetical protein [Sulfuricystis multivorans]
MSNRTATEPVVEYVCMVHSPATSHSGLELYLIVPLKRGAVMYEIIDESVCYVFKPIFTPRSLAQLRDTLLPKLISGEIRVKDAEAFLEERGL